MALVTLSNFGGINRVKSRTALASGPDGSELWDAQGVTQVERGRLRGCWEGTSAEATFGALTDGTTNIEEAPRRVVYFRAADKLIALNRYRAAYESGTTLLVKSASGATAKESWALDVGDFILVAVDGEPARLFYKTFSTPGVGEHFDNSKFLNFCRVNHAPIWLYTNWYTTSQISASTTPTFASNQVSTAGSATIQGATGPHGSGYDMGDGSIPFDFAGTGVFWLRPDSQDVANIMPSGIQYQTDNTASNAVATLQGGTVSGDGVLYSYAKLGVNQQQLMIRMPVAYRGRVVAVEGRSKEYSQLCANTGVLAEHRGASGSYDQWRLNGGDYTDIASPGDTLLIYRQSDPSFTKSTVCDYVWSTENVQRFTIVLLIYESAGPYTTILVEEQVTHGTTNDAVWSIERALTTTERDLIYISGRAADSANGISADERDFTEFSTENTDYFGESSEGAVTCLFAQGDMRLIGSRQSGLYEMPGDLPLGGVIPPSYEWRRLGSVGVYGFDSICSDESGQVIYFGSTDGGVYRLYGGTIEPIDDAVRSHENFNGPFSHLIFVNKKLLCLTDEAAPYIWEFDTVTNGWTYTARVNSGQDQTGTLAARELSDVGYASNKLYQTGDHGGIFAPYNGVSGETARALVCYKDSGDYKARTLNNPADEHNYANLIHGVKVQTGYIDGGEMGAKKCRRVRVLNTKPLLDDNGGAAFTEAQISVSSSEGPTTSSVNVTPGQSDSDSERLRMNVATAGRGDTAWSATVGDAISAIGEIASIDLELATAKGRSR